MTTNNGIWVFLSHSNKDFERVRILRNLLEDSGSAIARQIGVSPSTVGREISRNSTKSGKYV